MTKQTRVRAALTAAVAIGALVWAVPGSAQKVADPGFKSVGRGAPLVAALPTVQRAQPAAS